MDRRVRGLHDLVHDAIEVITDLVQVTQEHEAKRVVDTLAHVEPVGDAAREVDDARRAIAGLVFDSVRLINRGVQGASHLLEDVVETVLPDAWRERVAQAIGPELAEKLEGAAGTAQSALNALIGDFLAARNNELAITMSFAQKGAQLVSTREALAAALPQATDKLAIFVHGLGCNESCWRIGAQALYGDPDANYGAFLARDLGYTPLYLRYNTGRHVSENGRELARMLDELVAAYPLPVRELALIGHSMGGLVVRSAAHYAQREQRAWLNTLRQIVCLGSPHLGAPLEQLGNAVSSLLGVFDVAGTRVPQKVLDARSAGVKDLRFGYIADEEWTDKDPDAFLKDEARDVPLAPGVSYAFVASSWLAPDQAGAGLLGHMLVSVPSARGRGEGVREIAFHMGHVVYGVSHIGLLNHPDVYTQLKRFLAGEVET